MIVLGKPLRKRDILRHTSNARSAAKVFLSNYTGIVEKLSRMTWSDVEMSAIGASETSLLTKSEKAMAAFRVVAWHEVFHPFDAPARKHYLNIDRFKRVLYADPDALYLYGVFIKQSTDAEIYEKLNNMSKPTADKYYLHCVISEIAAKQAQRQLQ